jgi:hypothetical protein
MCSFKMLFGIFCVPVKTEPGAGYRVCAGLPEASAVCPNKALGKKKAQRWESSGPIVPHPSFSRSVFIVGSTTHTHTVS